MAQVLVECPVICPVCHTEGLTHLCVENVVDALEKSKPLLLTAECHHRSWAALAPDLNRIRRHLARVMGFTGSSQPWMDRAPCPSIQEQSSWHRTQSRPSAMESR